MLHGYAIIQHYEILHTSITSWSWDGYKNTLSDHFPKSIFPNIPFPEVIFPNPNFPNQTFSQIYIFPNWTFSRILIYRTGHFTEMSIFPKSNIPNPNIPIRPHVSVSWNKHWPRCVLFPASKVQRSVRTSRCCPVLGAMHSTHGPIVKFYRSINARPPPFTTSRRII